MSKPDYYTYDPQGDYTDAIPPEPNPAHTEIPCKTNKTRHRLKLRKDGDVPFAFTFFTAGALLNTAFNVLVLAYVLGVKHTGTELYVIGFFAMSGMILLALCGGLGIHNGVGDDLEQKALTVAFGTWLVSIDLIYTAAIITSWYAGFSIVPKVLCGLVTFLVITAVEACVYSAAVFRDE